jgi:hypothetical protein
LASVIAKPVAVAMLLGHHRLADGQRDLAHIVHARQPDVLDQGIALAFLDRQRHPMAVDRHPVLVVALIELYPGIDHVNVGAQRLEPQPRPRQELRLLHDEFRHGRLVTAQSTFLLHSFNSGRCAWLRPAGSRSV